MSSTAQQSEPSHVDLPPQPAMPPPPPLPSQQEPQARVSAAFHVPLSQLSSMSGRQTLASPLETPGLVGRSRAGVQFLADLVADSDRVGYLIEVRRIGPAIWEGVQLPLGPVGQRLQPMTYLEIYENIRALHGGGDYRIHVIDEMGRVVQQIPFRIDTVTEPPRMNFPSPSYNGSAAPLPQYRQIAPGMPGRFGMSSGPAAEEDEQLKLRNEERTVSAQIAVKTRKREAELLERRWQDEEEAARERKEKKTLEPALAANQQMQTLERQMAQQTQQFMQALQQQQAAANQQFQQLLLTLTSKKDDGGQLLMIESMKASQAMMTTLVNTMMSSSNHRAQESVEQVRVKAEQEHKFMEMMLRMQQGGGSKYEKLVESLVMAQVNKPQDSVQQAIQLLEMGRKQTMDMLEFRDERGGSKEDDFDYDPEAGIGGNIGKLIFGLLRGLMKGGGIKDVGAILQALNKTDPAQVQTSDLRQLAARLEQQYGPQFQQQQQQRQLPVALRQVAPVIRQPIQQTMQQQVVQRVSSTNPFDEELEEDGAAVTVTAAAAPQPVTSQSEQEDEDDEGTPEERLRERVNEMFRIALIDLRDGVRSPEWVDYALDKLNEDFLDLLVAAKDDAERVGILQEKADPALFQQIYSMLVDEQNRGRYEKFINGLHEIVAEHAKERNGTVLAVAGA